VCRGEEGIIHGKPMMGMSGRSDDDDDDDDDDESIALMFAHS